MNCSDPGSNNITMESDNETDLEQDLEFYDKLQKSKLDLKTAGEKA